MQNLLGALRYTLRQFRLSPVFNSAAILTLALGIVGTTAIFTLNHAVMLHSLPVPDPAQLCRIGDGVDCCVEGAPQERRAMPAKSLRSEYVTGNYFSTLGVTAFGGRLGTPDDDKPSSSPAAVISHQTWQTDYGADPSVVGSTFVIEGRPSTITGVTPPGFFGDTLRSDPPEICIPLQQEPITGASDDRQTHRALLSTRQWALRF
jgi:hypothetical protein